MSSVFVIAARDVSTYACKRGPLPCVAVGLTASAKSSVTDLQAGMFIAPGSRYGQVETAGFQRTFERVDFVPLPCFGEISTPVRSILD